MVDKTVAIKETQSEARRLLLCASPLFGFELTFSSGRLIPLLFLLFPSTDDDPNKGWFAKAHLWLTIAGGCYVAFIASLTVPAVQRK